MATKKKSPAVPARVVEITLVGKFPRPAAWGKRGTPAGDAAEIKLLETKPRNWHPCTEDFQDVAKVPNTQRSMTQIYNPLSNIGELLGAILDLGSGNTPRRPERSIKRLNLISHGLGAAGREPIYGLSGEIEDDGTCFLFGSVPEGAGPNGANAPMDSRGIDGQLLHWLNTTAKDLRDQCRARFREDGEIGLVLCNSGGNAFATNVAMLRGQLAKTFNVAVLAYDDEIYYHQYFDKVAS